MIEQRRASEIDKGGSNEGLKPTRGSCFQWNMALARTSSRTGLWQRYHLNLDV
jgi:hypothetical protein